MVAALALLTFSQPLALTLEVPSKVPSGKEIVATVWAENRSNTNLVLVRPELPNATLGMMWKDSLTREGEPIVRDEVGPMMGQWVSGREIDARPFLKIKPGQRVALYQERFKVYLVDGLKPSLISDYSKARRAPLPTGRYRLRFQYGFDRTFDEAAQNSRSWSWQQKLTKTARGLYNRTWTGGVDTAAEFEVTPAV